MVEKVIRQMQNVIDFASYQQGRNIVRAEAMSVRTCRHCGAALADGEREDECSSTANAEEALRWQAAQILRGLI
jgi:ribosomal protein L37AE/L43A